MTCTPSNMQQPTFRTFISDIFVKLKVLVQLKFNVLCLYFCTSLGLHCHCLVELEKKVKRRSAKILKSQRLLNSVLNVKALVGASLCDCDILANLRLAFVSSSRLNLCTSPVLHCHCLACFERVCRGTENHYSCFRPGRRNAELGQGPLLVLMDDGDGEPETRHSGTLPEWNFSPIILSVRNMNSSLRVETIAFKNRNI